MPVGAARLVAAAAALAWGGALRGQSEPLIELPTLHVNASHTANVEPAGTFGAPVSRLELNPLIDLQTRALPEAQGDVTIRGGIFENTGFRLGAATLIDPQTGHYFAEIPVAPEMLEGPRALVGADNALGGFNSSVGTVAFGWTEIDDGGSASAGFGENGLNYQRLRHGHTFSGGARSGAVWGAEAEASRSESDGTIDSGDHSFSRASARLQRRDARSQTDFFVGRQRKFLAWPELYAAPFGSNESDRVRTTLALVNHRARYGIDSRFEATAYYRKHHDHYLFDRRSDSRAFVHETEVSAAAVAGDHRFGEGISLGYSAQATADRIESTQLEQSFVSRSYVKLAAAPEFALYDDGESRALLRAGASYDDSNRDSARVSPLAELAWQRETEAGADRFYVSYSEATQVPGYTAIGGSTSGLFASNPDLGREVSRNAEIGAALHRGNWSAQAALFHRADDDLVDWTFASGSPNARSANNVDIDTLGFEAIASRRFESLEVLGSVTLLEKDEDYGAASVDASFYALNYAERRFTLAAIWRPIEQAQIRIDNEYRQQRANALREGGDSAFFTNVGLSFFIAGLEQLELHAAVENLWEEDFQELPGTPGRGRQTSFGATWRW